MRPKILVVDDELDILRLIEVVLLDRWDVVTAQDGTAALDVARREHPAAILLDARMPGEDGFATVERLRSDPATRGTPVILMTALAQRSNASVPPGFDGVIPKPFDPATLVEQIQGILTRTSS